MLPLDDKRWLTLEGGYREPFDPRPALRRVRSGDKEAWHDLWDGLHHQYDVGEASYATVPHLIAICGEQPSPDWNPYALIATIELCRRFDDNPPVPKWLKKEYRDAWDDVVKFGCRDLVGASDETTVRSILSAVALAKGLKLHGELILEYSPEELEDVISQLRGG